MFRVITLALSIITGAALVIVAMPADVVAFALTVMPSADHFDAIVAATVILGARAERVIRLHELPAYLGVRRSQVNEAIKKGLLHPRPAYPGARAQVVTEAEVISLQQQAAAEAAAAATAPPKQIEPNIKRRRARETAENAETAI
jgi:predicted DNA-binding transcriptional regulator AlpA